MCYLPLERAAGPGLSYLPFIILLSIVLVNIYLFLPETKHKSIDDIIGEFRRRRDTVSRTVHIDHAHDGDGDPLLRKKYNTYGTVWDGIVEEDENEPLIAD